MGPYKQLLNRYRIDRLEPIDFLWKPESNHLLNRYGIYRLEPIDFLWKPESSEPWAAKKNKFWFLNSQHQFAPWHRLSRKGRVKFFSFPLKDSTEWGVPNMVFSLQNIIITFLRKTKGLYHQEFDFQATNWLVSVQRPIQRRDWLTVRSDVAIICITLGSAELIGCKWLDLQLLLDIGSPLWINTLLHSINTSNVRSCCH